MKHQQQGSAHAVVVIVLVLALITALGWIFYQNFVYKAPTKKDTELVVIDKSKKQDTNTAKQYHDFRTDKKDTTGVVVASASDVDKLTDAGSALKAYFKANAGMVMDGMTMKYTVDRLEGDYAVGVDNMTSAYLIWGPKDGTGAIANVAGTQNEGFSCTNLEAAKVPYELVDGKCIAEGKGVVDYKG